MSVVFEAKYQIKETDIDIFGHMNNAKYLEFFEQARWDAIVAKGFDVNHIRKSGTGPVILECQIKYMKELHCRDTIVITMETLSYDKRIGKLRQCMIKDDGSVACEALFTYGLFDLKNRKLIEPTPEWKLAVGL